MWLLALAIVPGARTVNANPLERGRGIPKPMRLTTGGGICVFEELLGIALGNRLQQSEPL